MAARRAAWHRARSQLTPARRPRGARGRPRGGRRAGARRSARRGCAHLRITRQAPRSAAGTRDWRCSRHANTCWRAARRCRAPARPRRPGRAPRRRRAAGRASARRSRSRAAARQARSTRCGACRNPGRPPLAARTARACAPGPSSRPGACSTACARRRRARSCSPARGRAARELCGLLVDALLAQPRPRPRVPRRRHAGRARVVRTRRSCWRSARPTRRRRTALRRTGARATRITRARSSCRRPPMPRRATQVAGALDGAGREPMSSRCCCRCRAGSRPPRMAVRDGFIAAALAEPAERRPRIDVLRHGRTRRRRRRTSAPLAGGARAVAGPLMKEDVAALVAAAATLPVPTVALNSLPGDTPPPFLFQFALDPEQEARAVARRIAADGLMRGIALFPRNAWGDRLQAAFTAEAAAAGAAADGGAGLRPGARDYSATLRAALGRFGGAGDRDAKGALRPRDAAAEARDGPQFAFIAATPQAARALRPQLRFQMAYDAARLRDVGRLGPGSRAGARPRRPDACRRCRGSWPAGPARRSCGMPCIRSGRAVARGRLRLYAFGFDAYQLLRGLNSRRAASAVDGLTGRLTLAAGRPRAARAPSGHRSQGGRLQPAGRARRCRRPPVRPDSTTDGRPARRGPRLPSPRGAGAAACSSATTAAAPARSTS